MREQTGKEGERSKSEKNQETCRERQRRREALTRDLHTIGAKGDGECIASTGEERGEAKKAEVKMPKTQL